MQVRTSLDKKQRFAYDIVLSWCRRLVRNMNVGQREIYNEKKSLFVGMELSQARLVVVSPLHNLSIATSKPFW